jgi:RNA polymerase sigma-70 factor (ECF subfamily)
MDAGLARSKDVDQALAAPATEAPSAAELVFEELYRSSRGELRLALAGALERLERRERELIALKFFAGLSNAEIARVLGISESNVGTKLDRTVTKLREACHGAA